MEFIRSETTVTLKNIYTDKNSDVMIAQLEEESLGGTVLPYKGTDFSVFLESDSLSNSQSEKADILFGRFSTDGDLFLIIPKPTNDVYTAYIMNNNFISTVSRGNAGSSGSRSVNEFIDEEGNFDENGYANVISSELSDYTYYGDDPEATRSSAQVQDDTNDIISMRLTLDPAFDEREYQPTVINESLLTEDNQFDFETFFNSAFRETAINDLQDEYDSLTTDIRRFEETKAEFEQRLIDNPSDQNALTEVDRLETEIEQMNREQDTILNTIAEYETYEFDAELFRNMNTEATIVR